MNSSLSLLGTCTGPGMHKNLLRLISADSIMVVFSPGENKTWKHRLVLNYCWYFFCNYTEISETKLFTLTSQCTWIQSKSMEIMFLSGLPHLLATWRQTGGQTCRKTKRQMNKQTTHSKTDRHVLSVERETHKQTLSHAKHVSSGLVKFCGDYACFIWYMVCAQTVVASNKHTAEAESAGRLSVNLTLLWFVWNHHKTRREEPALIVSNLNQQPLI